MKKLTTLTPIAAMLALSLGHVSTVNAADGFQLSEKLSVTGFIDMSILYTDVDGSSSTTSSGLDQFEIDLMYDFDDKLKAQVDLEYQNNDEGVDLEQAFITYAVTDSFTAKAGRFLSYSGWETEEPTGLFQYSGTGYASYFYGGYQQGVSGLYTGDGFAAAISVINDLAGNSTDSKNPAIETMFAIMPTEEITVKAFYSMDKLAGTDEDTTLFNIWGSYGSGPLTLAAEYNSAESSVFAGSEATGYLVMANYAFDSFGLTLRYHAWEIEDEAGVTTEDMSGITISPSFSVSDNLLMVFEYRMDTDDLNDVDGNSIAVEALVTF